MDIRALQYFLAVAREGNITKAAETLHMTQPPLSRQMKELESELGKQLLVRGSKRITLTEEGQLLQRRAEEMLELFEKTKAEINSCDAEIGGEIYIGGGETQRMLILARAAKNLRKKHPLIRFRIFSGDADHVTERLDRGLIDFGLLVEPADMGKYDYLRLPGKDTWGVLMRSDSPLAQKASICPQDLWDQPLMLSHQTADSSEMAQWMGKDLSRLHVVVTYELAYNASRFVKAGFGYALTLDQLINTTGDADLCFRPLSPVLESGLCVVWKKHPVFSKACQLYLQELKEEILRETGPDPSHPVVPTQI